MTDRTKTTKARQPGPTRAPLKDQPEGSPEVVDKELARQSGSGDRKGGKS
jgi:hypothetical protein